MYYKRKIFKTLLKNIDNKKIIILTGSRQVGKTSLMKMIFEKVEKESKTVFLDMDISGNHDIANSLETFLDYLFLNGYNKRLKKFFVFIDEFQRIPRLTVILKNIYDHYPNIKIFASGSSSLSIKNNIKESLAGRKYVFEIFPLDFEEFLDFKKNEKAKNYYNNISKLKSRNIALPAEMDNLLNEFITFGSYPEVTLAKTANEKKQILNSIFDLYLEKDVMMLSGIENIWAYKKIMQILAVDSGQLLNYNNLAKEAGVHNKTVRSYLALLEDSYLIKILRPFSTNKHSEITKSPKIYFLDNGVRNFFLNNFNKLERRVDRGGVFENYVLQELVKSNLGDSIKFWRTKNNNEVDYIIEKEGKITPIEVKIKGNVKRGHYGNVLKFLLMYKRKTGYVLSMNFNYEFKKDSKIIKFIPAINLEKNIKI